ncbi:MAG: response regulator transcription factor [Kiritimatiellia bacterium]|jgi:DNA-binding NarL/FixJ family response regulator|nr:response regulator transcription factor [Kiritimatiellia bacterium]
MRAKTDRAIRLMLVDDHPVMRAGLANLLSGEPGFSVVAQASEARSALAGWREHRPDVLLLDISLPGLDGIEVLRQIKAEAPQAHVLMLTSSEAKEDVRQSMAAGAAGYVTKNVDPDVLFAAIRDVFERQGVVAQGESRTERDDVDETLSQREQEVLNLVRQGFSNGEIGRLLGISRRTARAHVSAILRKLGASARTEAVTRGFERGILKI